MLFCAYAYLYFVIIVVVVVCIEQCVVGRKNNKTSVKRENLRYVLSLLINYCRDQ